MTKDSRYPQIARPPASALVRRTLIVLGIVVAVTILVVASTQDADAPHGGHSGPPANSSGRAAG